MHLELPERQGPPAESGADAAKLSYPRTLKLSFYTLNLESINSLFMYIISP